MSGPCCCWLGAGRRQGRRWSHLRRILKASLRGLLMKRMRTPRAVGCARILVPTGTWVNGRLMFVYSEGTWGDGGGVGCCGCCSCDWFSFAFGSVWMATSAVWMGLEGGGASTWRRRRDGGAGGIWRGAAWGETGVRGSRPGRCISGYEEGPVRDKAGGRAGLRDPREPSEGRLSPVGSWAVSAVSGQEG